MHGQLPRNWDEKLVHIEQSYCWLKSGDIKGKQKAQYWQLKTKELLQSILRIKYWRKNPRVNAGYVNNMKKLLTT